MEARTARSRRTRQALVDATRQELATTGTFTADGVAAAAGCSVATFYAHFPTKDDALTEAFTAVLDELLVIARRHFGDPPVAWPRVVDALVGYFRRESLVFRAALARLPHHRPLRDAYRASERATLAVLVAFVETGQSAGRFRAGDADTLALDLLVVAQGCNNPRLLRAPVNARAGVARALAAVVEGDVVEGRVAEGESADRAVTA